MPEPWEAVKDLLARRPDHLHFVESMDRNAVESAEKGLPQTDTIVGIGGGSSLDMAKYAVWKRGLDPVLVPSIASVDACVTNTIAVRDNGKVRYQQLDLGLSGDELKSALLTCPNTWRARAFHIR